MKEVYESIGGEYINDSIYSLLSGSFYVELADKLRKSKKCLVNIKNDVTSFFLWFHIRHLNPLKTHAERVTKADEIFEPCMDFLSAIDDCRPHYFYIKYFNKFISNKTKHRNKKHFC